MSELAKPKPRIAVCGIHIESSTFTPYVSTEKDFLVTRGTELMEGYKWRDDEWAAAVEWLPTLHARALPGGVVSRQTYSTFKDEIVERLRAEVAEAALDGVFFDIHGAMSVEGLDDAEGDLIEAVRDAVGDEPLVSASMDLHGNMSSKLFEGLDLMTCYRMAPHEDALESRERAARNLVERIQSGAGRPSKFLVQIPVLLPGEKTSTRMEPARSLYALVPEAEKRDGVLDAGIWIGFAWADQERCRAAVVVTGDDITAVEDEARRIAGAFWNARTQFAFVAPAASMTECLTEVETGPRPFFISDSGDNPGAGGAGDVTVALRELLEWRDEQPDEFTATVVSILDPESVQKSLEAGVGNRVDLAVGGKIDGRFSGPVAMRATVRALVDDPDGGMSAAVETRGVTVVLTSRRNQYSRREQFARLGLSLGDADLTVVKMGYLEPDLFATQKGWMLALTPGGVPQDLASLDYQKVARPMFPLDDFDSEPELVTRRWIPETFALTD